MSVLETIDARGLLCPLPVIRTQDAIKQFVPGTVLEVLATDAGTLQDIPAWCRVHGHELLKIEEIAEEVLAEERAEEYEETGEDAWGRQIIRITIRVCA